MNFKVNLESTDDILNVVLTAKDMDKSEIVLSLYTIANTIKCDVVDDVLKQYNDEFDEDLPKAYIKICEAELFDDYSKKFNEKYHKINLELINETKK